RSGDRRGGNPEAQCRSRTPCPWGSSGSLDHREMPGEHTAFVTRPDHLLAIRADIRHMEVQLPPPTDAPHGPERAWARSRSDSYLDLAYLGDIRRGKRLIQGNGAFVRSGRAAGIGVRAVEEGLALDAGRAHGVPFPQRDRLSGAGQLRHVSLC